MDIFLYNVKVFDPVVPMQVFGLGRSKGLTFKLKSRFMDNVGRLISVNFVTSFMSVHFLIVFAMKNWAIKKIDKIRRAFLWKGS